MIMLDRAWAWESFTSNTPANPTPATKKTTPKPEEEISVEDIPF